MKPLPFAWRPLAGAALLAVAVGAAAQSATQAPGGLTLEKIGGFAHPGGASSSEVTAYDPATRRLYVVNGALGTVDVLDVRQAAAPQLVATLKATDYWPDAGGVNSVAVHQGLVALAVEARVKTDPGRVVVLRTRDLGVAGTAPVGALPDMLTFTPNGATLLVANEGEPNSYGQADSVDPEGSISLIDVRALNAQSHQLALPVRTADFRAFNDRKDALLAAGVRIFGPGASVAQDLEPEYIAVADHGRTAYITLQENNAVAVLDIASATVTDIKPLGTKDHSLPGNGMDVSNEDAGVNTNSGQPRVNIAPVPVKGLYMPDAIASYSVNGQTYLITANEGDAREYAGLPGGREDPRVRDHCGVGGFDPAVFGPAAATLGNDSNLGRLRITQFPGGQRTGKNAAGQCNELVSFGARSFSIWDTDLNRVFDSGDQFERLTQNLPNVPFNASNDNATLDDRSPAKGPEPEGVAVARLGSRTYAFIGLERVGGIMVYDVTQPRAPQFVHYTNSRNGMDGDRGPEGVLVIPAQDSPDGTPWLVVGHETSGTTVIYRIQHGH